VRPRIGALAAAGILLVGGCAPAAVPDAATSSAAPSSVATTSTTVAATTSAPKTVAVAPVPAGQDRSVERVVDGDTIVVDGGERVRLIGVNTPETKDPRRGVQCFGHEASAHTESLLPPGTAVRLVGDVDPRDRYGRTLAYVYRSDDGLFVNADLVAGGFAQVMTVPPNVAHADEFLALQQHARDASRGLWDPAVCPP